MKSPKIAHAMNHLDDDLIIAANGPAKAERPIWVKWVSVAAAFLLIISGVMIAGILGGHLSVDATVALDVNPSIEIEINKNEKVIDVKALNSEGEIVLDSMDLGGLDINIAVNAIVGSMFSNGYLSADRNSILLSVNSDNSDKVAALQEAISGDIEKIFSNKQVSASVISQEYVKNDEVAKKAADNHISVAKAALIEKIVAAGLKDSAGLPYSYESLAHLKVNELKMLLESKDILPSGLHSSGKAENSGFIGANEALDVALAHAELTKEAAKKVEVELDYEDGLMVYSVEFKSNEFEYEYEINASSGKILESERDPIDKNDDDRYDRDDDDYNIPEESTYIGSEAALAAALSHAKLEKSAVSKIKVELDRENRAIVYSVEFESAGLEYEYEIDPKTGAVINFESEPDDPGDIKKDDSDGNIAASPEYIGSDAALDIALAHAKLEKSSVSGIEVELDKDGGLIIYSIEFESSKFEFEYEIEAKNGAIIKSERERLD